MTTTRRGARAESASIPTTVARHGRLVRHGKVRGILQLLAAAVVVILVSVGAVSGLAVWNLASQLKPGVELVGEDSVPDIGAIEGEVNLLLVGSDSGGGNPAYGEREATLNDVTMLLHISADHSTATVVSFPRDLFVPIPACPRESGGSYNAMSSQKINTTLSYGGLACTVLTVEELTGLSIPYAAKIEFDGVIAMSNAVGGVQVCVGTAINDKQINFHLAAGEHTLSGHDALQFVRTRYGVGNGSDLSRISNQQVFLSSLARTIKSAETLSDPVKVFGLASAAVSNMELSNSLRNLSTMAAIAVALKDINLDEVSFLRYPGAEGTSGSQSGVLPNRYDAEILFDALASDQPVAVTGNTGSGSTVNPNAPAPEVPSTETPGTETPGTTAPGDEEAAVQLPDSIKGQTAGTYTCSKGQ